MGVSNRDTERAGRAYQQQFDVPYPLANDGATWARWGVPYQPVTVFVDKRGREAKRVTGHLDEESLRLTLDYLVTE